MAPRGQARTLLLEAAVALFGERGYDRTTTRDVAERAGVDAALIARHFGGKDGLYVAALRQETGDDAPPDLRQRDRVRGLLDRVDGRGAAGPVLGAVVQAHADPAVQQAAAETLRRRLVQPLADRFAEEGLDRPVLRAEVAAAAVTGVLLARRSGTFPELSAADPDALVDLVLELLEPSARAVGPG
ncbi:MAG: hypothetical protein JWM64_1176 [Frankiales bacterium]|nr:hypothetical protein [Frankiales bacterium]